jgi:hypothetical protein
MLRGKRASENACHQRELASLYIVNAVDIVADGSPGRDSGSMARYNIASDECKSEKVRVPHHLQVRLRGGSNYGGIGRPEPKKVIRAPHRRGQPIERWSSRSGCVVTIWRLRVSMGAVCKPIATVLEFWLIWGSTSVLARTWTPSEPVVGAQTGRTSIQNIQNLADVWANYESNN